MKFYEFAENFEKDQVICVVDKNGVLYEGRAGVLYTLCTGNVRKETATVIDGGVVQVSL